MCREFYRAKRNIISAQIMDKSISKAVSLNYHNINQVDRIDSVIGTKKFFKKHYFCDNFDTKLYEKLNNNFSS